MKPELCPKCHTQVVIRPCPPGFVVVCQVCPRNAVHAPTLERALSEWRRQGACQRWRDYKFITAAMRCA